MLIRSFTPTLALKLNQIHQKIKLKDKKIKLIKKGGGFLPPRGGSVMGASSSNPPLFGVQLATHG